MSKQVNRMSEICTRAQCCKRNTHSSRGSSSSDNNVFNRTHRCTEPALGLHADTC